MRRSTASLALLAAAALAAPTAAGAKGYAAASVCGATACRAIDATAVRTGFEDFDPAPSPDRAEPFLTIHLRARVSSGKVVEVYELDWLPGAGLTRGYGERLWARPGPVLDRALRRAAAGLERHPAGELGSVYDGPPQARVVEVFSPARESNENPARGIAALAAGLLAAALAAIARRRRHGERQPATLPPAPR